MEKCYKKFYEIGYNRYYVLPIEDTIYLATETYIPMKSRFKFGKDKTMTQGLKLLELTAPISILFQEIANLKPKKEQTKLHQEMKKDKNISEDDLNSMLRFENLTEKQVKDVIYKNYENALKEAKKELKDWYNKVRKDGSLNKEGLEALKQRYNNNLEILEKQSPLNQNINIDDIKATAPIVIKDFMRTNGFKHLYTDTINNFVKEVYLYDLDVFGQVTIYRFTLVKNTIKSVESFVYDKKLISELLKFMCENNI